MSTITLSTDIPTSINTLERHLAWAGYTLAYHNPTATVLEQANNNQKAAQAAIFKAADETYRLLIRACLPVSENFMNDRSVKIWMHTQELSNTALSANFKSN